MQILPLNTLSATPCNKLEIKMTAHVGWIYKRSGSNKQTNKEEVRRFHQTAGRSRIHNANVNGGTSSSVVFQMIISLQVFSFLVKKIEIKIF